MKKNLINRLARNAAMLKQKNNFIEDFPFPLLKVRSTGEIYYVSAKFEQEFGIFENNIKNQIFEEIITFPDNSKFETNILSAICDKESISALLLKSKECLIDVLLNVSIVDNEAGCYWLLVNRIPSSQSKYQPTSNNFEQFNRAVDGACIGIWEYNLLADTASFSRKFKELVQINANDDLTWQQFKAMIVIEDREVFELFLNNHIHYNMPLNFEFRIIHHGVIRWLQLRGEVFLNNQQEKNIAGSITDCTIIKQTLSALNDAIDSKNMTMKAGGIGTWSAEVNGQGTWLWTWDSLANGMFNLKEEDIGKLEKFAELLHPEDAETVLSSIENSLETGKDLNQSYRSILSNGETKFILSKGKVSRNIDGKICRIDGISIDQTAIYDVQKELEQLNSQLEERVAVRTNLLEQAKEHAENASKIKTDFLSMMSHELRTPMNGVIGSLDLLATTNQTFESLDLIETAKTSANNLVFILNDILDVNKIEAGKLEIEESPFSIQEVIDNIVQALVPTLEKNRLTMEVFEDPRIPCFVKGDVIRVRQVLYNIVGNAIKFTKSSAKKQGNIKIIAKVEEEQSNDFICTVSFTITDTGIGISPDVQQKLFMPFTQAERSTTRKYGGTGLGLAICGKLTEMMGGRIDLQSELGKGSSFSVEFPFWKSQETMALDVESLSGARVALVSIEQSKISLIERWAEYLRVEGADTVLFDNTASLKCTDKFDAIIILIDQYSSQKKIIKDFYQDVEDGSKISFAIERSKIREARSYLPGARLLPIKPLTRAQLIKTVNHIRLNNNTLELDEIDLSNLELDIESPSSGQKKLKEGILVVEDNPLNQKIIAKQMKHLGFACDLANDGKKGIEQWKSKNYKLILTDCHMPNIDGYEMTKSIRQLEKSKKLPPIPVVAVTGAAMTGDSKRCYDAGMSDFISKPVQLTELKEVLNKWYCNE